MDKNEIMFVIMRIAFANGIAIQTSALLTPGFQMGTAIWAGILIAIGACGWSYSRQSK